VRYETDWPSWPREGRKDMKKLTKPKTAKCCPTKEKTAQCCAKASRLVAGCHD